MNKDKLLNSIARIANNALYFDDNSDFKVALWEILEKADPKLFEGENDYPKLEYLESE